jgi:DNA-binding NarL/FixJ family response regulator
MKKIKVLLVDDQILFVESLRTVLESENFDVIGMVTDGQLALESIDINIPDVILMDVRMPNMNGVECTRIIKTKYPEVRILMLTTFDDDEYVIEALNYGAAGYLLKDVHSSELVSAIHAVYEGGVLIAPRVATNIFRKLSQQSGEKQKVEKPLNQPDWFNSLNNREKEILILMAKGMDNKEIAKQLYVGEQTIKNYVSIIYSKLGVRDRALVSKMVNEAGLG